MLDIIIVEFIERKYDTNPLMCPRRESPGTDIGRHLKSVRQGITKGGGGGVCQPEQVSLWLASETIYCLLRSDSLWQLVPFSWCGYCKATSAYVLLRAG